MEFIVCSALEYIVKMMIIVVFVDNYNRQRRQKYERSRVMLDIPALIL